jgi:hypothetical protein
MVLYWCVLMVFSLHQELLMLISETNPFLRWFCHSRGWRAEGWGGVTVAADDGLWTFFGFDGFVHWNITKGRGIRGAGPGDKGVVMGGESVIRSAQHGGGRPKKRWRLEPRKGTTAREVGRWRAKRPECAGTLGSWKMKRNSKSKIGLQGNTGGMTLGRPEKNRNCFVNSFK